MNEKVLFDLDDTLVIGDLVQEASFRLWNKTIIDRIYTQADVRSWDMSNLPDPLRDEILESYSRPSLGVWYKKPMYGVYYFLLALKAHNFSIGILTARPSSLYEETCKYLKQFFPLITFDLGINFCNKEHHQSFSMPNKKKILEEIMPDFYFDDIVKYCLSANELGIKSILVSNGHTPWNATWFNHTKEITAVVKNPSFIDPKLLGVI